MTQERKLLIANILAFICALWFLFLGWIWVYFFNVVFVFPIAIAGFFLWRYGRKANHKLFNKIIGWMLVAGVVSSLAYLIVVLIDN